MVQIYKAPKGGKNSAKGRGKSALGKPVTCKIDRLDHLGQGVVVSHSPVIFVAGALPGETCKLDIIEKKARFWRAKVNQVISPSTDRIKPFCPHFELCGGCQSQYISPHNMLAQKQLAVQQLLNKFSIENSDSWQAPVQGFEKGYRRKTRLSIDARNQSHIKIGFRQKEANKVVAINQCDVLVDSLQKLLLPINDCVSKLHNPNAIGHISLLAGSNVVQLCLRQLRQFNEHDLALWRSFASEYDCQLVVELKSDEIKWLAGPKQPLLYHPQAELGLHITSNDFVQVNDVVNQKMVAQAISWLGLTKQDNILDLFCGVGNFSLPMARKCKHVTGVEGVAKMVQRAQNNAQKNDIGNCLFTCLDLNSADLGGLKEHENINKVLLDPAREGARGIAEKLAQVKPSAVLYVSCNPATFARDAAEWVKLGYRINKISLLDMFPNTAHTELMALFVREH